MDRHDRLNSTIKVASLKSFMQIDRNQSRLPVMAVDQIRPEIDHGQDGQRRLGEERELLNFKQRIVAIGLESVEVKLVIDEIELDAVHFRFHDSHILVLPVEIHIEPGRSIISTSGVTLYTVGSSKQVPGGRKYVAVDGGMADNPRPSMYQAKYTAQVANKIKFDETEKVTIAGRYCESGDILIEEIELPKLEAGDILCVYNTGAYNYSMASNYNRVEKPAMVLVNNSLSDIIVYRETLDNLISHDNIPDRLLR